MFHYFCFLIEVNNRMRYVLFRMNIALDVRAVETPYTMMFPEKGLVYEYRFVKEVSYQELHHSPRSTPPPPQK